MDLSHDAYDGVLIGSIPKRTTEQVLLGLREYKGARFIDIRSYFLAADGEWRPSTKGITLPTEAFGELAETVGQLGEALGFGQAGPEE